MKNPSAHGLEIASEQRKGNRFKTLLAGSVGHLIEWYDWSIYGLMTAIFAQQIFPASSLAASLIASYSVFAIGYVGRPLGAFLLSPLADKLGRRKLLSATILMSGGGCLIVALCPTYAQVGLVAPLLLVFARLLQGIAAGGEFQIAVTFLNEHASNRHRAVNASPQMAAIGLGILMATGVSGLVSASFAPATLTSWGWRLPFVLGAILSLFGLYIRRDIGETPAFERLTKAVDQQRVGIVSILSSLRAYPKEVFTVFVIQMNTVQYFMWMIFLPTYAHLVGQMNLAQAFTGSVIANVVFCVAVPILAAVSDRIGRKPMLISAAFLFLFFTYPLLSMLVGVATFRTYLLVAVVGSLFVAMNNSVIGTVFAELFPTHIRTSGIGVPYAISALIFGGTAPLVATWLQGKGGTLYLAAYIGVICIVSIFTYLIVLPETYKRSLV
ncbi:hypothetical protein ASG35_12530 [Burkholderia sp. Leaf177]|uniref:MFS transporter n=1 Tax=Burkholderia sp. Leaf177 TaxID=1736287 RepID=UPI000713C73D|nr:MFS transporter [Burkholderia sp. Leaf177]KQR77085.1 hypothetical protein ASG35_12530 [Burkholderia sp. Leaf177]